MHLATRLFSRDARRRFVATLAGAATALGLMTAAAVPARAAPDAADYARALAAIAAIAIIAKAAEGKDRAAPVHRPVPVGPGLGHRPKPGWGHGPGYEYGPGYGHGWGGRVLPAACAISVPAHRGPRTFYLEPCLRRSGIEARLPGRCREAVRIHGRVVPAYPAGCLFDAGFRREDPRRHGPRYRHGY
jgi:hypothetical protein